MLKATLPRPAVVALAAACGLSGCANGVAYPSLASRPVERLNDTAPVATTPVPATPMAMAAAPSPELATQLGELLGQARSAKQDFDDKQAAAGSLIAAAGAAPAGSEDWARATQALSGVEAARAKTAQPLTELDRLDVDDRLRGAQLADGPRPDTVAIAHIRATISALVTQEDALLANLDNRLAH